jgi:histone-lysine N-methyltransferase SETMAR
MEWYHKNSPVKKKPRISKSSKKIMASVFWDERGVVFIDFLEKNTTINKERYCQTLGKLKRAINLKRTELRGHQIIFHQDNARPHTALQTMAKISKLGWTIMPHPPYSPDLAPSDFFLFGHLKRYLRGKQFESDEELKKIVKQWFKSQEPSFYQTAFTSWRKRWSDCVEKGGGYIE